MNRTIVALFTSREDAEAARKELIDVGIPPDDLHVRGGSSSSADRSDAESRDPGRFWRSVLETTDAGEDSYAHYAEAERRGNAALVVEDVEPREAATIETALVTHGVLDIEKLADDWRTRGWHRYDERAPALSPSELDEERRRSAQFRAGGAPGVDPRRCIRFFSVVIERSGSGRR